MKERYNYIDYSKAFAILLVITGYICLFCINRGNVNNADNMRIYSWLTVFQMPLFLSGIVIKHKDYSIKETIKHLYKKTRQLLVPFFLFGTIFTLFIHQGFCEFITPVMKQGYWYLLVLFELYLIYYFCNGPPRCYTKKYSTPTKCSYKTIFSRHLKRRNCKKPSSNC